MAENSQDRIMETKVIDEQIRLTIDAWWYDKIQVQIIDMFEEEQKAWEENKIKEILNRDRKGHYEESKRDDQS